MSNDSTRIFVGKRRKDGKYPVQIVYPTSGSRGNYIMTKEALDEFLVKNRRRGDDPILQGYTAPPKSAAELEADIAEALAREQD